MRRPIFENMTLAHLQRQSRAGTWLTPHRERRFAAELGANMRLKAIGPEQDVLELSGGNQQKVVLAKAVAGNPRLLLLEEPTRGVDVGAKFDIYLIVRELTARGAAVILVSSDLPELIGISDRIAIMRQGEITTIVEAASTREDDLINLCYGRPTGLVA